MADKPFVHTVHTVFHMHTSQETMHELLEKFERLGEGCGGIGKGILFWKVGMNVPKARRGREQSAKTVHMVQIAIFADTASFQNFRAHPAHVELKETLKLHADWASGDLDLARRDRSALLQMLKAAKQ